MKGKSFILIGLLVVISFIVGAKQEELRERLHLPKSAPAGASLSAKQLKSELGNKQFTLLYVQTPYEGEIPGTDKFIPSDQMKSAATLLPQDKTSRIIVYSKDDTQARAVLQELTALGYTRGQMLAGGTQAWQKAGGKVADLRTLEAEVIPESGIELPIVWGDIGPRLVALGVIDMEKFKKAVQLTPDQEAVLTQSTDRKIKIDRNNGQFIVDVLWALGLAQKSIVYDQGPMGKEYKGQAGNFASTGGWNLGRAAALTYLNKHSLIPLTPQQQEQVGEIARHVYRPCCGNATWFPDCNHGMAALAAIELMVAAGVPEESIYRNVLALNSYWFADSYLTIATYFARQGTAWKDVNAQEVLGVNYSSGAVAADLFAKVGPLPARPQVGGGCSA